jgi:hypothetical protein
MLTGALNPAKATALRCAVNSMRSTAVGATVDSAVLPLHYMHAYKCRILMQYVPRKWEQLGHALLQ